MMMEAMISEKCETLLQSLVIVRYDPKMAFLDALFLQEDRDPSCEDDTRRASDLRHHVATHQYT